MKRTLRNRATSWVCLAMLFVYLGFFVLFSLSKLEEDVSASEYLFEGIQFFGVVLAMMVLFFNHFSKTSRDGLEDFQRSLDKASSLLSKAEMAPYSGNQEKNIELLASYIRNALVSLESISAKNHLSAAKTEHESFSIEMAGHPFEAILLDRIGSIYRSGCCDGIGQPSSISLILKFINPHRFHLHRRIELEKLTNEDLQFFAYGPGQTTRGHLVDA